MDAPKTSKHQPIIGIMICFSLGILIDAGLSFPVVVLYGLAVILVGLCFLLLRKDRVFLGLLFMTLIVLGMIHSRTCKIMPVNDISHQARSYYGKTIELEGVIASDVEKRRRMRGCKTIFTLEIKKLQGKNVHGKVLVNLFRDEDVAYGNYLAMEGKLHKPFNFSPESRFSYQDYLGRKGIEFILSIKKSGKVDILKKNSGNPVHAHVLRFKHKLNGILETHFTGTQKGIMQGFLLGDRYNIPEHINELFKIAGVAHILAISGFNVGIVAYATFLFLKIFPIGRRGHYLLTMIILIGYAILTGSQPPVVRATIMAVVLLAGFILELEMDPVNTLACAALIILLLNPTNLFDVGFQLSFVSVLSIMTFYPKLAGLCARNNVSGEPRKTNHLMSIFKYVIQSFMLSFCAYLGIAVMIAYYFDLVTPVALLANLLVIPLASLIVVLGIGLLLTGLILPWVTFLFADCIKVILALMVKAVFLCVHIPGAYFRVQGVPLWVVMVYYLAMLGLLWRLRRKTHFDPHLAEKTTIFS